MRIHLSYLSKRTTISVDEQLLEYLQTRLTQRVKARLSKNSSPRLWIQHMVNAAGHLVQDQGLSQWVQCRIIDLIADPLLKDEAKQNDEAVYQQLFEKLTADERATWLKQDDARDALLKQHAVYQQQADRIAKQVPRYKGPPRVL